VVDRCASGYASCPLVAQFVRRELAGTRSGRLRPPRGCSNARSGYEQSLSDRAIPLPAELDVQTAEAELEKGVLTVRLTKTGEVRGHRRIALQ
jgi:hypothetical protein